MATDNANGTFYLFDCLDGIIGDRLLTLSELYALENGQRPGEYTEKEAVRLAQDYEATLYRYEYEDGERVASVGITGTTNTGRKANRPCTRYTRT